MSFKKTGKTTTLGTYNPSDKKDNQPKKAFQELLRTTSLKPENLDAQIILGHMRKSTEMEIE